MNSAFFEGEALQQTLESMVAERARAELSSTGYGDFALVRLMKLTPEGILVFPQQIELAKDLIALRGAIVIRLVWQNAFYEFQSAIEQWVDVERGEVFIKAPTRIDRIQRRDSYRVGPSIANPINILAFGKRRGKDIASLVVFNISLSGICVLFRQTPEFHLGETIDQIEVQLAKCGTIRISGEIRRIHAGSEKYVEVGIRFQTFSPGAKNALAQYMLARQREDLSRRL
ncbi:MAG: PilZ domain-containing protein [Deltaproteobacteria bacterium]|nr:PilZ domain-containing protein [Deltaproteobacteria bacterium]